MITIDGVTVRVGQRVLLQDVRAELRPGIVMAIVGPNGAGKSTLLRAMCGEFACSAGCVRLDGLCVRKWPAKKIALRRAVLPQQSSLSFPFTAREVVMLGRLLHRGSVQSDENDRIVNEALRITHASHLGGQLYATLSGGERQRVHLARVLAQIWKPLGDSARYLWLDEPTTGLDLAHQDAILRVARRFASEGGGVFCILHDLNLAAAYADHLLVLDKGLVKAQGSPEEVLRPELIERVFGIAAVVTRHPAAPHPLVIPIRGGLN